MRIQYVAFYRNIDTTTVVSINRLATLSDQLFLMQFITVKGKIDEVWAHNLHFTECIKQAYTTEIR